MNDKGEWVAIDDLTKAYAQLEDVETYFKGKGIDIDENTLAEELKGHPEWIKKAATVQSIGAEASPSPSVDERSIASKIFGVDLTKGDSLCK